MWHGNGALWYFVNKLRVSRCHLVWPKDRDTHAVFQCNVIAINYSRCPSLFPSYRTRWPQLRRGPSSHSLCWGRKSTPPLWGCPRVLPHRTHSSRPRGRRRGSSRTECRRASASRSTLLRNSHSFWGPEKGKNCNSPEHTQVAEPASNCSLRNQTEWRNPKTILGSRESQGTKSLIS